VIWGGEAAPDHPEYAYPGLKFQMDLQNFLIFTSILTVCLALTLAGAAWRLQEARGKVYFIGLMASIAIWTCARAFEAQAQGIPDKVFWAKAEYLGIASLPTFWMLFSLSYLNPGKQFSRRKLVCLSFGPALMLGVVVSNDLHHLFWSQIDPVPPSGVTLIYSHGPLFWGAVTYNYLLILYSTVNLVRIGVNTSRRSTSAPGSLVHRQGRLLILAALLPFFGNAVYLLGLSPVPGLDLTPFGFTLGGLVILTGVFRDRLLDLVPLARDALVENLSDAVFVFDRKRRVIDMNAAARRLAGLAESDFTGQPVERLFTPWIGRIAPFLEQDEARAEVCLHEDPPHCVDLRSTTISDHQDGFYGKLLVLRDITERRLAERQLQEALELNRKIISASSLGILVYGDSGQCLLANGAAARITGGSVEALLQQNFRSIRSWQASGLREAAEKALSTGQPQEGEFHFTTTFGVEVWMDCHLTPFSSSGDRHLLLILNDVTERVKARQAEHEQRVLAEALRDTALAINQCLDLPGVQERILANIGSVVQHDSASIILMGEGGGVEIAHAVGYTRSQLRALERSLRRPLDDLPHLRKMVETGQPAILPDTRQDALWTLRGELPWLQGFAGAPIIIKGQPAGFICLESTAPGLFHPGQSERLQSFALEAAIALENARLHAEVQRLTITDELTNVYNYRGLMELGEREFRRAARFKRPLSALFIDLDHFRVINNNFSHATGNVVLREVARRFQASLRSVDLVGRYGGEEFVVLLPEIPEEEVALIAERLRQEIESIRLTVEGKELRVTASFGTASLHPGMTGLAALLDAANRAEHSAKASGRNCVIVAEAAAVEA
jgi:diguanylate cyclase (GGDEF)-like protein/PAS domain S-box-containing protein